MSISNKNALNISKVLTEALPYIRKFNNKIVVIKYGGNAMENKTLQKNFARNRHENFQSMTLSIQTVALRSLNNTHFQFCFLNNNF